MRLLKLLSLIFVIICALVDTGNAGLLIDSDLPLSELVWARETTGVFLGSPSIAVLPNQMYLASHDEFGPGGVTRRTHVYSSQDRGINWKQIATVQNQYWSSLFFFDGSVYLLGTTADGSAAISIARSIDQGITWSQQVLFPAPATGSFATGATPVLIANGRVWKAMELWAKPNLWPQDFQSILISAKVGSDLMLPASWSSTATLPFNRSWLESVPLLAQIAGYLEGNAVLSPDGSVKVLLRMPLIDTKPTYHIDLNHACLLNVATASAMASSSSNSSRNSSSSSSRSRKSNISRADVASPMHNARRLSAVLTGPPIAPEAAAEIVSNASNLISSTIVPPGRPAASDGASALSFNRLIQMPGGGNKFVVRKDNVTGLYVALSNPQTQGAAGLDQRNILELVVSPDLVSWRRVATVLADDTGLTWPDSLHYTGFHYIDYQFGSGDEEGDILAVIRTAYRGANSYHNSNRITFTRVRAWRQLVTRATSLSNGTGDPKINLIKQGNTGGAASSRLSAFPVARSAAEGCMACVGAACLAPVCRLADKKQSTAQQQADFARPKLSESAVSFYWGSKCCSIGSACGACATEETLY